MWIKTAQYIYDTFGLNGLEPNEGFIQVLVVAGVCRKGVAHFCFAGCAVAVEAVEKFVKLSEELRCVLCIS